MHIKHSKHIKVRLFIFEKKKGNIINSQVGVSALFLFQFLQLSVSCKVSLISSQRMSKPREKT